MEPIIKQLKIYYGYTGKSSKKRPYIRLCGEYLAKMNFQIGEMVRVEIVNGQIIISKVKTL